ncbi:MAG: 4-hydroxy-tetrahydrodipicolinate synthase, partial [Candidatus Marinimicrobia bacterium]|nr:4-hydroxy-tetrahydrodipicolinate synthase [Candidatus Neomarinimicrobiota bacterium]
MFKGLGTALITPFTENGEVDYDAFRKLIHYQINGGADCLIVLGT